VTSPPSTSRDTITLRRMQFHASVGAYSHERQFLQPIEIDLSVEVERLPDGGVVDYAPLYAAVARLMGEGHIEYIETIAERVAAIAVATAGVAVAHVAVRKPHVALGGPLDFVELRITRAAI